MRGQPKQKTLKPFVVRTIRGGQERVRKLEEMVTVRDELLVQKDRLIDQLCSERRLLAMMAAEGPCFNDPAVAAGTKQLRDIILRDECQLAPNGTPITKAPHSPRTAE